jgi:MoaA/NifB/PqqE/SkfB family radical SAM enzyme
VTATVNIVIKSLYACAHQCGFCHVLHVPRNISYMPTAQVKETFDRIEEMFEGRRVELEMSGGEFTQRKDAVELIEYLRTKRIWWSSLVLDTMGVYLADSGLARALGALFDKANVSIHACDPAMHTAISGSATHFEDLEQGLGNIFRFFPAVFTNTSINRLNYHRLADIAAFILRTREASRQAPLYCLYYLPVHREYGAANKENRFRIHGEDNTDWLPPAADLPRVRSQFERARFLLARRSAPAVLRDFNLPACIQHAITGTFPENAFGLPNFMVDCYFTDFAHPISERHTLEDVYPSRFRRTKTGECGRCAAADVCPGMPEGWLARGYEAKHLDESEYQAALPIQVLNQTLFGLFHDAVRTRRLLQGLQLDWAGVAASFFDALCGEVSSVGDARSRISRLPVAERASVLALQLRRMANPDCPALAGLIEEELGRFAGVACCP